MVIKSIRNTPGAYVYRQQHAPPTASVENSFIGGLKTEFTGLNFPENASTDTSNCVFSLIGDVDRRGGIDFEAGAVFNTPDPTNNAINKYRWRNAGGDGQSEILVVQTGAVLSFYLSSASTTTSPLSAQKLSTTININTFIANGNSNDPSQVECQFADGNGYLFVFHPFCDSFSCTFNVGTGVVTASVININIRDFQGIPDGLGIGPGANPLAITLRPNSLSNEHKYNLLNQGWTNAVVWTGTDASQHLTFTNPASGGTVITLTTGNQSFSIGAGFNSGAVPVISTGQAVTVAESFGFQNVALATGSTTLIGTGVVSSYNNTSGVLVVKIGGSGSFSSNIVINGIAATFNFSNTIQPTALANTIGSWNAAVSNFPSNADVWWIYKNTNGTYTPSLATGNSIVPGSSPAAQGHFIFNAFNQDFAGTSGISDKQGNPLLTAITTTSRCSTGAWFAGRVWFTGITASQAATGDQPYYTWTENIYFSQVITSTKQFGYCYQVNDPTNQNFFDILPTDGGVITIQGTGTIYKLFPMTNGLLVFAQNGIWFITGGQSLGFTATDYSINKISNVQCISPTSFINVLGVPFFWNTEGIYTIQQGKDSVPYGHGGLIVQPLTVGTILTFYNNIPLDSKRFARGDYNPVTYIIEWVYRSTQESGISNRYSFDSALNLNIYNKAFYPYAFAPSGTCTVSDIVYMSYPNSANGLTPQFKYLTKVSTSTTFSEENNFTGFRDWFTIDGVGVDYTSYFVTGYKLHGQALRRWKPVYLIIYLRNGVPSSYTLQAIWDYATSALGRESTVQTAVNFDPLYTMLYKKHKLRGHGKVMQIKISSVSGQPFDIMGWAISEQGNVVT